MKYRVLVISGLVSFVVHMIVFLLMVKLDPVMEAHDLFTMLGFTNKHMLKSTGIFTAWGMKGRWADKYKLLYVEMLGIQITQVMST